MQDPWHIPILKKTGVTGGVIVHLGCGDGQMTAALRADDSFLVHGLDADARNVQESRERIQSLGLYGKVSVDTFDADEAAAALDSLPGVRLMPQRLPDRTRCRRA